MTETNTSMRPFADRLGPAIRGGGYREDDYWVWCGSVAKGEDGLYHMFAARWPKSYPFFHGYLASSEVVRAVSEKPEGPYTFAEVVLPDRGEQHWDGRMTHNPFIVRFQDTWCLFYIGTTYSGPRPSMEVVEEHRRATGKGTGANGRMFDWYNGIRIGVATAPSLLGPWIRPDTPSFDINPDGWDNSVVTNPSPCLAADGRLLLYYRSAGCRLGVAALESMEDLQPGGPGFIRLRDEPVVQPGPGLRVEDPYVFWNGSRYEMVCKDLTGKITGEFHASVHLHSDNALDWELAPQVKAWSRTLDWDDGTTTTQGSIERPFILWQDGQPRYLFAATADGPGPQPEAGRPGHFFAENTWNLVRPLK